MAKQRRPQQNDDTVNIPGPSFVDRGGDSSDIPGPSFAPPTPSQPNPQPFKPTPSQTDPWVKEADQILQHMQDQGQTITPQTRQWAARMAQKAQGYKTDQDILQQDPRAESWNELGVLGKTVRGVRYAGQQAMSQFAEGVVSAAEGQVSNLEAGLETVADMTPMPEPVEDRVMSPIRDGSEWLRGVIDNAEKNIYHTYRQGGAPALEEGALGYFATDLSRGAGDLGGMMLLAGLTGPIGPALYATGRATDEARDRADKAVQAGLLDEDEAAQVALKGGLPAGTLEMIPATRALKRLGRATKLKNVDGVVDTFRKKTMRILKEGSMGSIEEVITETGATLWQDLIGKLEYGGDMTPIREYVNSAKVAGPIGFLASGGTTAAGLYHSGKISKEVTQEDARKIIEQTVQDKITGKTEDQKLSELEQIFGPKTAEGEVDTEALAARESTKNTSAEQNAGAAQTALADVAEDDGTVNKKGVQQYVETMEPQGAELVTSMMDGDGPFVVVNAPLDTINPNILQDTDIDPQKMQYAKNFPLDTAPPVVVGQGYMLADGGHRFVRAQQEGAASIPAIMSQRQADQLGLDPVPVQPSNIAKEQTSREARVEPESRTEKISERTHELSQGEAQQARQQADQTGDPSADERADVSRKRAGDAVEGVTRAGIPVEQSDITPNPIQDPSNTAPVKSAYQAHEEAGSLREQLRTQRRVDDGIRAEAVRLAQESLPIEERGRVITQIRDARTLGKLRRSISRIRKVLRQRDHKDARRELGKAMKQAEKTKLRPEFDGAVKDLTDDLDTEKMTRRTEKALKSTAAFLSKNPDHPLPDSVLSDLKRLSSRNVHDMSASEIRGIAEAIRLAIHLNKTKNKMLGRQRGRKRDNVARNAITDMVNRVRPLRRGRSLYQKLTGKLETKPRRRYASLYIKEASARPEVLVKHLSPELGQIVYDDVMIESNHVEHENFWRLSDKLTNAMTEAGAPPGSKTLNRFLSGTHTINTPDGPITITGAEAVHIYTMMRDPSNRSEALRYGLKNTRTGRKHKITSETLKQIGEAVGPIGQAISDAQFDAYNGDMKNILNDASVRRWGYEIANIENYAPRRRDTKDSDRPSGDPSLTRQFAEATVSMWGHLRERIGGRTALEYGDGVQEYLNHASHVSRIGAYLNTAHDAHAILGRADVRQAIEERVGEHGYNRIVNSINDHVTRPIDQSMVERAARQLNRSYGVAMLGYRYTTLMLQSANLGVAAAYMKNGWFRLGSALAKVANNPGTVAEAMQFARNHSPAMRSRYEDFMAEMSSGMTTGKPTKFGRRSLAQMALGPLQWSDKVGAAIRLQMAKDHVRDTLGIPETAPDYNTVVAREWEKSMFRSENTSQGGELPGALAYGRRNPMFSPFVAFSNSAMKVLSAGVDAELSAERAVTAFRNKEVGRGSKELNNTTTKTAGVVAATMYVTIARSVDELLDDDDDRTVGELVGQGFLQELVNLLPVIGPSASYVARRWMDLPARQFSGNVYVDILHRGGDALAEGIQFIEEAYTQELDKMGNLKAAETALTAADKIIEFTASIKGWPYEGPRALYQDIKKWVDLDEKRSPAREQLNRIMREYQAEEDISEERDQMISAIRIADSERFRKMVTRMKDKRSDLPPEYLVETVKRHYQRYVNIPERIELTPQQREWWEQVMIERSQMIQNAASLTSEHIDLFREEPDTVLPEEIPDPSFAPQP